MHEAVTQRLLAVDAGNTRVKWGIHDGREWFLRGAFATAAAATAEAFSHLPDGLQVDRIMVSNVAGAGVANAIKDALYKLATPFTFIESRAEQCGVTSHYQPASTLGADRWAALIAAHAAARQAPTPLLVVMAGTALTVDALTADGAFLGGIIVPGPALMRAALHRATAQLPVEAGDYQTFPGNTLNAMASGAVEACSGAVQRMYTHLSAQSGDVPHCIASGGAIHVMSAHLPFPVTINDNLVLDGLREMAATNSN
ncbi:MAG: type III pantothenate kinase [Betaproteobacteria bacterium]